MSSKTQITYFFRKPQPQYHSIERVFGIVMKGLMKKIEVKKYYLQNGEKGILSRFKALLEVRHEAGEMNHITGDISYVALALPKKGLVVTFHDLESLERSNRIKSFFLKWLWVILPARRAEKITVISEHTKRKVIEWSGVDSKKIFVIPNPLPDGFNHTQKEFNSHKPIILAMGTKANKNLEGIISAVQHIRCQLIISGKLTENQNKLLKESNIEFENLTGATDEQIIDAYKRCDLLCFPSFFEGFGMPIIEAQSMGRPVITSNQGAMMEIAGDGALLVNPNNTHEIYNAIKTLMLNNDIRNDLVEKGKKNAERFTPEKVVEHYLRMYEGLGSR